MNQNTFHNQFIAQIVASVLDVPLSITLSFMKRSFCSKENLHVVVKTFCHNYKVFRLPGRFLNLQCKQFYENYWCGRLQCSMNVLSFLAEVLRHTSQCIKIILKSSLQNMAIAFCNELGCKLHLYCTLQCNI